MVSRTRQVHFLQKSLLQQRVSSGLPLPGPPTMLLGGALVLLISLIALLTLTLNASGQGTEATWVGEYEGNVHDVELNGQYAYLATDEGLVVLDVTDLSQPEKVGEYRLDGGATTIALDGIQAYLGSADGLWIVNVSSPASPSLSGNTSLPGPTFDVAVNEGLAYVACGEHGLRIVNVSEPALAGELGSHVISGTARAVVVVDGVAFVAWGQAGLQTIDVSDPEDPQPLDSIDAGETLGLAVRGDRTYLAVNNSGLHEVDISNPGDLGQRGFFSTLEDQAMNLALAGNLGLVAVGERGVQFIDIDSPIAGWTGTYDTPGTPLAIKIDGRYAFIADGPGGLQVVTFNSLPVVTIFSITPIQVLAGETVTFRGQGYDPDGTIDEHLWESSLDGQIGSEGTFSSSLLTVGRHVISFRVCDDNGACSQEVTQPLQVGNARPTAQILKVTPSPAIEDDEVFFSGQGQDQDGTIMEYEWRSSLQGSLSDQATFSTDSLAPGNHTLTLRVRDDDDSWSEDATTWVQVQARPTLGQGAFQVLEDELGRHHLFTVDYLDPEAGAAPEVKVTIFRHGQGTFTMTDPEADGIYSYRTTELRWGYHNFSFQAISSAGARAKGELFEHELYVNALPQATIHTITPSPAILGTESTFSGQGTDLDGSIVAYRWSSSIDGDLGAGPTLTRSNLSLGEHVISLAVQDDAGAWSPTVGADLIIGKGPEQPDEGLISPQVVQIGVATSTIALSGLAFGYLAFGETFRYRYWALLAPLMVGHRTELSPADPLANEIRGLIRGYLLAHPGSHYSLLKDELGLVNGTLAYHLQVLEREGLVASERNGRMRHFFAIGKGIDVNGRKSRSRNQRFSRWTGGGWGAKAHKDQSSKEDAKLRRIKMKAARAKQRTGPRPVSKELLLELLDETPGMSQTELAEAFGVTSAAVKYHTDGLVAKGLLNQERNGMRMEYHRVEEQEPTEPKNDDG